MKYEIILSADEFQNIKYIGCDQTFYIKLKCSSCRTISDKLMVVTFDSKVRKDVGIFNFICKCHSCDRSLKVNVHLPKLVKSESLNEIKQEDDSYFTEKNSENEFVLSQLECLGSELYEMKVNSLAIISNKNEFIRVENLNEKDWAYGNLNEPSAMFNYLFKFRSVK